MTGFPRRCPEGNGTSLEAQRTDTRQVRPRARYDPSSPGSGVRDAGPWLRAPCERLDAKSGCNAEHRLIDSKRNQCPGHPGTKNDNFPQLDTIKGLI